MANTTNFGPNLVAVVPVTSAYHILKVLTNGTASPEVIFNAANPVVKNFRVIDFTAYNNTGVAQAGATATLQSDLNGLGLNVVSDAVPFAILDAVGRATTISSVQGLLTQGSATEDILNIAKNANTNAGYCTVLAVFR